MRRETRRFYESTRPAKGRGVGQPGESSAQGRVSYKTYPRFPSRALEPSAENPMRGPQTWPAVTRSDPGGSPRLSFRELSTILYWSCGITAHDPGEQRGEPAGERMYASAGGIFPVEVYLLSHGVDALPDGLHHCNVRDDELELLLAQDLRDEATRILGQAEGHGWSAIVCMTGVLSRSEGLFGTNAYRHALIEAGQIGQNIHLLARGLGRRFAAVDRFDNERLERLLDLTGSEIPLFVVAVG